MTNGVIPRKRWISFGKSSRLSGVAFYVFQLECGHTAEQKITPRMRTPKTFKCIQCYKHDYSAAHQEPAHAKR